jgi:hypothetical protein
MAEDFMKTGPNRSPEASDKSTQLPKGPSVNEPTRTSPAATPPTLGPRCA